MSVDNVQNNQQPLTIDQFRQLSPKVQKEYQKGDYETRLKIAEAINSSKSDGKKGVAVEAGTQEEVSPEESLTRKQMRAARKAAKEAEIARQKQLAEDLYKPTVMSDAERQMIDDIIGKDGAPLYKNQKARKELRKAIEAEIKKAYENSKEYKLQLAQAETDEEKRKIEEFYEQMAETSARIRMKDLVIADKMEHTRMFETREDMHDAKKGLGDDAKNLRFTRHTKRYMESGNVNLHYAMEEERKSAHQHLMESVEDISGDNTFEPNEVNYASSKSNNEKSYDAAMARELKRAGFDVKSDAWKNVVAGVSTAALTQAGTAAISATLNAIAIAIIQNPFTGEILKSDVDKASTTYTNWKGIGIGASAGAVLGAALFGKTKDEDVLHNVPIEAVFKDDANGERAYENMSFGSKNDTLKVKTLLRAIDELNFTDEQKTQFLADAAGEDSQQILSKKELAIAYAKAYESLPDAPDPAARFKIEAPKPELNQPITMPGKLKDLPPRPTPPAPDVLINNGDTFQIIADRFGVDVDDLIAANMDIVEEISSGHTDCKNIKLEYLLIGKPIKLPANADREAVEKYNKEFTVDRIQADYIKYVTGDEFLEKNRDCYRNIKAAGPEAEKAFADKITKEAKEAGLPVEQDPKSVEDVLKLRDEIDELKTVVENQKNELKNTYGVEYNPEGKTLQEQTIEMNNLIDQKINEAREAKEAEEKKARVADIEKQLKTPMIDPELEKALKKELEELTGREARAAEILKEFQSLQGPVAPEILNKLNEEYQKLTGKPISGDMWPGNFNPFI